MGLKAIPMKADSGPIGGDMSHEFIVLADTGESAVFCDKALLEKPAPENVNYDGDLQPIVDSWTSIYAATDEKHDAAMEAKLGASLVKARGIEVGHIFHFGTKYSEPMGAKVTGPDGNPVTVAMGSYGIGVSRLVGAIIESSHDENGIVWPDAVAPFQVGIINLKVGDAACDAACNDLYAKLKAAGREVLYDDRDERPGVKFADMDLIGVPWQLVIGPKGVAKGMIEVKRRSGGVKEELSAEAALKKVTA
jgi:prolyl-tRNA synthetase